MKFETVLDRALHSNKQRVAIASAGDQEVLGAAAAAIEIGLADFILFGDEDEIVQLASDQYPSLIGHPGVQIIHCGSMEMAAELAVKATAGGKANILMKGNIPTAALLKAALNKEHGLRTGKILSHVAAFEIPGYDRLIYVTDAAMNINPALEQKAAMIENAVSVARAVGLERPKVAVLAAVETINTAMQSTLDAALLSQMNRRGQIRDCSVDGPLALDNAISPAAALHKGLSGEVAGKADILLVPGIETGNALYKSLVYFAGAKVGAVIAGAAAPIILTSRSDSAESKLYSLALGIAASNN